MKRQKSIQPPRWAETLLTWYCRPELLEDLQGDLNEYFERNRNLKGSFRAKLIYVIDVFKFSEAILFANQNFSTFLFNGL